MEENCQQGEEEARLQLPVSPMMSRADYDISKVTTGFIDFMVYPLVESVARTLRCKQIDDTIKENRKIYAANMFKVEPFISLPHSHSQNFSKNFSFDSPSGQFNKKKGSFPSESNLSALDDDKDAVKRKPSIPKFKKHKRHSGSFILTKVASKSPSSSPLTRPKHSSHKLKAKTCSPSEFEPTFPTEPSSFKLISRQTSLALESTRWQNPPNKSGHTSLPISTPQTSSPSSLSEGITKLSKVVMSPILKKMTTTPTLKKETMTPPLPSLKKRNKRESK
jgi:hypothetical protein